MPLHESRRKLREELQKTLKTHLNDAIETVRKENYKEIEADTDLVWDDALIGALNEVLDDATEDRNDSRDAINSTNPE